MSENNEHQKNEDILAGMSARKHILLTTTLWFLVLSGIVYSFSLGLSRLFLIVIIIVFWRLSKRYGILFNRIMFPEAIISKILASKFYRIYLLGIPKTKIALLLIIICIIPFLCLLTTAPDLLLNPVINLSEMQVHSGTIHSITLGNTRRATPSCLWLKRDNNELVKLRISSSHEFIKEIKKIPKQKEITVWSKKTLSLVQNTYHRVCQLQCDDVFLLKYNKDRHKMIERVLWWANSLSVLWIFFSLLIIVIKINKQSYEEK